MAEITAQGNDAAPKDKDMYDDLEIVLEMYERGFKFLPIDLYKSDATKFKVEEEGSKVAILGLGDFYQIGEEASKIVEDKLGFKPTLINPRFASGVDKELLEDLKQNHELVITLEDGILRGGFGESIASFYGDSDMKVKNYGLEKEFYDRYNPNQLLDELGITPEKIVNYIESMIK